MEGNNAAVAGGKLVADSLKDDFKCRIWIGLLFLVMLLSMAVVTMPIIFGWIDVVIKLIGAGIIGISAYGIILIAKKLHFVYMTRDLGMQTAFDELDAMKGEEDVEDTHTGDS